MPPQPSITEKQFERMVQSIPNIAMVMLDPTGHILSWNLGAQTIKGYTPEEIQGRHFSCLYPPEEAAAGKPQALLDSALAEGRVEVEGWRIRKDGSRFWASVVLTPLYDHHQLIGFAKVTRDFTRRQQNEENLKNTLKELADIKYALDESAIVVVTDRQGVITYVNDTFCRISQYTREELLGKTHRIINSGYHPKSFFADMWQTIGNGQIWRGEIKNKAKNGSYYWVDTTIVPFLDDTGQPYQYVSIRQEITARKRIEQEIRQLNEEMEQRILQRTAELKTANEQLVHTLEQLQESEKARSTFISALTHDLRTPLVAQERAVELFLSNKDKLPPRLATLAERLYNSNQGLIEMVNMLLETYQYESGKISLLWESLSLYQLADTCFEDICALADSRQITLKNTIPSNLPDIRGDAHQIKRVLINLIGNALQNIPEGSEITLGALESQTHVTLTVNDNGPGIPPETLKHLFERYHIGDQTRRKIGTGLGLYICRMIMEHHQGTIRAESTLGQGTTFYLQFLKQLD